MRLVVKYDGASLSTAPKIADAVSLLSCVGSQRRVELAVVCSAVGSTTDTLIDAAARAKKRDSRSAAERVSRIAAQHRRLAASLVADPAERAALDAELGEDLAELGDLVAGMSRLGDISPRSMDYLLSFGERLSSKTLSRALRSAGIDSVAMTGGEAGILTDSNFGEARPLIDTTRLRVARSLEPLLESRTVPVVGGYAGTDQHGRTTTLGRGGSDYTATIIASCIRADEVWLLNDVGGLMTADPALVPGAQTIGSVSYLEAIEMTTFGARQIHPKTFEPLLDGRTPTLIARSQAPAKARRSASPRACLGGASRTELRYASKRTIKCASTLRRNGLIDIRGGGMVGEPGTAARIFGVLADASVNVMMITQNPSESSITIVVKRSDLDRAVHALEINLLGSIIKKLEVLPDIAIVALIGAGMKGAVGVAARALGAVSKKGVNILMITQGSSELNLAFVVKESDSKAAVRALHAEFKLRDVNAARPPPRRAKRR